MLRCRNGYGAVCKTVNVSSILTLSSKFPRSPSVTEAARRWAEGAGDAASPAVGTKFADVAHRSEHRIDKAVVLGSTPSVSPQKKGNEMEPLHIAGMALAFAGGAFLNIHPHIGIALIVAALALVYAAMQ